MATELMKMYQKKEWKLNTMIKIYYISTSTCGPCKMFKPIIEKFFSDHPEIENEFLDAHNEIPFKVNAVPTIIFFKDNKEVTRVSGIQSKNKLEQLLDEASI
jgi:thioredoxin-like negative regulator of GroEL